MAGTRDEQGTLHPLICHAARPGGGLPASWHSKAWRAPPSPEDGFDRCKKIDQAFGPEPMEGEELADCHASEVMNVLRQHEILHRPETVIGPLLKLEVFNSDFVRQRR